MTHDEVLQRWPGVARLEPRAAKPREMLERDEAAAAALVAYLTSAAEVPDRGDLRL